MIYESANQPVTLPVCLLSPRTISADTCAVCRLGWKTTDKVCRPGRVHVHFLQCVISLFVELVRWICGRTKEFLLLLRICSTMRVYGMCTHCRCSLMTCLEWLNTPNRCGHKTLYAICKRALGMRYLVCQPTVYTGCPRTYVGVHYGSHFSVRWNFWSDWPSELYWFATGC